MKNIHRFIRLRLIAALLVAVTVIGLSALAMHAPTRNQSSLTLKNIHTDRAATFYADQRPDRAWFCEAVLPTSRFADNRAGRAWFCEAVLPTGDSNVMTENLKSVAATL